MDETRMKELLNQLIDHVAVASNTSETVSELLQIGFTSEELVNEFGFSQSDVDDVCDEESEVE